MRDDARQGSSGLTALLRTVVGAVKASSGADMVVLVLYDEATHRYYAPVAETVTGSVSSGDPGVQDDAVTVRSGLGAGTPNTWNSAT